MLDLSPPLPGTKPLEPARDGADYQQAADRVRLEALAAHTKALAALPQWVVYGPNTTDHPGLWVARLWVTRPEIRATEVLLRAATLGELRALLPPWLAGLPRSPQDDPAIVETWI